MARCDTVTPRLFKGQCPSPQKQDNINVAAAALVSYAIQEPLVLRVNHTKGPLVIFQILNPLTL